MNEEATVASKQAERGSVPERAGGSHLPAKPAPPLALRALVASTLTGIGMIALLYLVNPTGGIVELLPDNLPLLGNLDEAGATAILLMVLSYWGMDVTRIGRGLGDWSRGRKALPPPEDPA